MFDASQAANPTASAKTKQSTHQNNSDADIEGTTQMRFSAMGKDYTLDLAPSNILKLPSTENNANLPTLLQGTVVGYDDSWARITVSDGKPTGFFWVDNQLYKLELSKHLTSEQATQHQTDSEWVIIEPNAQDKTRIVTKMAGAIPVTRAIRIGIAIDTEFNLWHRGRGLAKALEIINGVDGLYQQQLGLAVNIESIVELHTLDTDPLLAIDGRLEDVLLEFRDFRLGQAAFNKPLSLVHLFSGHRDPGSVVGLGWIDTTCRPDGYDLSVSTPFAFDVLLAAHEIAHNLGALHDGDPRCAGNVFNRNTLMVERLNSETTSLLSSCSINSMRSAINRSCNIDNLDIAVRSGSTALSTNPLERRVSLFVDNTDVLRRAGQVNTRTSFPANSIVSSVPGNCTLDRGTLLCTHVDIPALGSKRTSFVISLQDQPTLRIITTLELSSISDININNNRSNIDALAETGEALAQSDAISAPSSNGGSAGSLGRVDYVLLFILLIALQRRATIRRA